VHADFKAISSSYGSSTSTSTEWCTFFIARANTYEIMS
jgi:hypothetical protein